MLKASFMYFLLLSSLSVLSQELKLEHVKTFQGHTHGVRKVVFSPDGSHFASGGTRGEVFLWNVDGGESLKRLEGHYGSISDLRYSKDGNYIITAGNDGQIKVWDASTGFCTQRVLNPTATAGVDKKVGFATLSIENGSIYFGDANRNLFQVGFKGEGAPEMLYTDPKEDIRCGIVSPDGSELIFAAGKYLMALDLKSGKVVREYNTGSCMVNALEFSSDGKRLLTWCSNSRVDMREPSTFFLVTSFRSGSGGNKYSNLAFTEDQKYVVTGDHASRFNVWDLKRKQLVLDQGAEQGTILAFDVESGPNYLLSASLDKSIKLWQIVPKVEEDEKPKKKKKESAPYIVVPEVEIVQYDEPIEDVKQEVKPEPKVEKEEVLVDTLVLVSSEEKVEEVVEIIKPKPAAKPRSVESELPERMINRRVKPIRHEHKLKLSGGRLTFEIWDAQVIDGDIVSIYVGDECIVKEYSITAVKKVVEYDASVYKRVYIYLHAHNLGTLPPNTVTMTVSDGETTHQVELRSDLSGSAALELTFEDLDAE